MLAYALSKLMKKARLSSIVKSTIDKTSKVNSGTSFVNSSMARHSYCGYDCSIINTEIGAFCSIASNVKIGGAAHPAHFVSTSPVFLSHKDDVKAKFAHHDYLPIAKTNVGHDVWIGEGAFLKAGIRVGIGAIVGMGAVVTKDVPPYAVVAGNPARMIKKRFPDKIVRQLLETEWWNMDDSALKLYGKFVNNPQVFIRNILYK